MLVNKEIITELYENAGDDEVSKGIGVCKRQESNNN